MKDCQFDPPTKISISKPEVLLRSKNNGQNTTAIRMILVQYRASFIVIALNQLLFFAKIPSPKRKIYCGANPKFKLAILSPMGNLILIKKVKDARMKIAIKIFLLEGKFSRIFFLLFSFKYIPLNIAYEILNSSSTCKNHKGPTSIIPLFNNS
jgi:hypothetical protein